MFSIVQSSLNDNAKKYVTFNEKTGKLTVKKGFVVGNDPKDNQFKVKIKAEDYPTNNEKTVVTVEVTDTAVQIGEVYLAYNGKKLPTTIDLKQAASASIVVKDTNGDDVADCTLKAPANWWSKTSKGVTFTATAKDGGNSKKSSAKYIITYANSDKLKMVFDNQDDNAYGSTTYNKLVETGENTYEYIGTINPTFEFALKDGNTNVYLPYYGCKIKVDNGKLTDYYAYSYTSKTGGTLLAGNSKAVTTITITRPDKKAPIKVTLTNKNFQTAKAPGTKLVKGSIYAGLPGGTEQSLTYKVTGKDADKYDAVYLSYESGIGGIASRSYPINEDGEFTLKTYSSLLKAGTGKYTVVFGEYERDQSGEKTDNFLPRTKAATLSVKVSKLATVKPQASYTLNLKHSKYILLTAKPDNAPIYYSDLRNDNVKGQPNEFIKYFTVADEAGTKVDNTGYFVQLEATKALMDDIKADKVNTANLTGYVKAKVYNVASSGYSEKDVKITVKIETADKKYAATGFNVLNKKDVTGESTITLNKEYVQLDKIEAVDKTNWQASIVQDTVVNDDGKEVKVNTNKILLKALSAPAAGKQNVEVRILPTGSQSALADAAVVKIPVTVKEGDKTKGKVKLKTTSVDLASSKKVSTAYDSKEKCGKWVVELYENTDYEYTFNNIELEKAISIPESMTNITAEYVAKTSSKAAHIAVTVWNNDAKKLGKTITVPMEVTLKDVGSDTLNIKVIIPKKVLTMQDMADAMQKFLSDKNNTISQTDIDTEAAKINAEYGFVNATLSAKLTAKTAATATEEAKDAFVTITVTDKADSKNKLEDIEVTLPDPDTSNKKQTLAEAYKALEDQVKLITADEKKDDKGEVIETLVPTNEMTRFDVRQFLSPVVTNDAYMLSILNYRVVTKATTETAGTITFTYRLVSKNSVGDSVGATITIPKIKADDATE